MPEVVIVSAVRTPVGRANKGTLRATRPDDLAAVAIKGALERVPQVDPREIEDVILRHDCVVDALVRIFEVDVPPAELPALGPEEPHRPWRTGRCDLEHPLAMPRVQPRRPAVALEVEALIGIYDWERRIRQPLLFDVEMSFDNRIPAASDAIEDVYAPAEWLTPGRLS